MKSNKLSRDIQLRSTPSSLSSSLVSAVVNSPPVRSYVSVGISNPSLTSPKIASNADNNGELSPENPLFSFLSATPTPTSAYKQQNVTPHYNASNVSSSGSSAASPNHSHQQHSHPPPLLYSKTTPLSIPPYPSITSPPSSVHSNAEPLPSMSSSYQSLHWSTLQFINPLMEKSYRNHLAKLTATSFISWYGLIMINVCVLGMVALTLATPIYFYDDNKDVYIQRIGLFSGGALLIFSCTAIILHHTCYLLPLPRLVLSFLSTVAGVAWAIAGVLHNDALGISSYVPYMIVFLVYLHVISFPLLFLYVAPSSTIIGITYIMCTIIERSSSELWLHTITNYGFLAISHLLLNYYLYVNEQFNRRAFAYKMFAHYRQQNLQQEVVDLRHKIYTLVLEKYDIADMMSPNAERDTMELKKPEQDPLDLVMCILAKMKSEAPKKTSKRIDECLTLCSQARR